MPFDHFDFIAPLFKRVGYQSTETLLELADMPSSGWVLDAGGGTGRVARKLVEHAAHIVVVDPSQGMLRQADHTALRLACSNCEQLPFQDGSFERVIMIDALHHVEDQSECAREMVRVLKPGGRILIEEPDIRTFAVKLVAVAEKLLLMRSHFLNSEEIEELFSFDSEKVTTHAMDGNIWVVIEKPLK